jgi:LmbE family N-acetylglucosaminyl deacetylase
VTGAATPPLIDPTATGTSEHLWLAELERRSPPILQLAGSGRVVVVSPHPDDEVLGAGGLLRQLICAGWQAELLALTDGEAAFGTPCPQLAARRVAEQHDALAILGVNRQATVHRLRFPDGAVSASVGRLTERLRSHLGGVDLCIAPWSGDGHPDHEAAGVAAHSAAAAAGVPLFRYPVWLWHWADPARDLPWERATQTPLSFADAAAKAGAVQAFTSQLGDGGRRAPILTPAVLAHFARPLEVFLV